MYIGVSFAFFKKHKSASMKLTLFISGTIRKKITFFYKNKSADMKLYLFISVKIRKNVILLLLPFFCLYE